MTQLPTHLLSRRGPKDAARAKGMLAAIVISIGVVLLVGAATYGILAWRRRRRQRQQQQRPQDELERGLEKGYEVDAKAMEGGAQWPVSEVLGREVVEKDGVPVMEAQELDGWEGEAVEWGSEGGDTVVSPLSEAGKGGRPEGRSGTGLSVGGDERGEVSSGEDERRKEEGGEMGVGGPTTVVPR